MATTAWKQIVQGGSLMLNGCSLGPQVHCFAEDGGYDLGIECQRQE